MTMDEARAIVRSDGDPPVVKWMDSDMRWHYGYIVSLRSRNRASIRGKERLVPVADLSLYVRPEPASND